MPSWSRPVDGHRHSQVTKAGIPDFQLYVGNVAKSQSLITEVKAYWAYSSIDVQKMLMKENYGPDGYVDWRYTSFQNQILKQASHSLLPSVALSSY